MQAVGRLGSYISKGVYTVSGPFHPFGGAVDIIVVQQQDGSYKSSPWYVRFGKFQGVLKAKEKVVNIHVNGVETKDLHMYLDHKGEAFFLKEIDVDEGVSLCSPPSSSGEDTDRQPMTSCPLKSRSCNYDSKPNWSDSSEYDKEAIIRSNSRRAQLVASGSRSSRNDGVIIHEEENVTGVIRTESLERAEMAADLLDLKWSTNLLSSRRRKKDFPPRDTSKDEMNENLQVDVCNIDETDLTSDSVREMKNGVCENGVVETSLVGIVRENENVTDSQGGGLSLIHEEKIEFLRDASENIVAESHSHSISVHPLSNPSKIAEPENVVSISSSGITLSIPAETKTVLAVESLCDPQILSSDVPDMFVRASIITEEEKLLFGDLDDSRSNDAKHFCSTKEAVSSCSSGDVMETNEFADAKCCSSCPLDQSLINDYIDNVNLQQARLRNVSSAVCISKLDLVQSKEVNRMARSLPTSPSHNNLEASDLTHSSDSSCPDAKAVSANCDFDASGNVAPCCSSLRGSQRSWPVPCGKSNGVKVCYHDMDVNNDPYPTETLQNNFNLKGTKVRTNKKKVKTLTPTSEQLASLNLKEGKNTVVFTFSTSMLGAQQVDARIFLWRWDTRIVISDVDGTITRSDLLGQVMPLVGMDWSQTGVAHLFSAIKENGYELIFLSARSISQSFITRQFLFNIKQDGKALPEGPVVISPDGLFPSLYREVVRRAPHEFKIACLEDIKALFPADSNPFYAGFGNRDTDEFSYLKVGIPSGKIFIINPKGDIVVNRRVNKKSYSSLHALVHGMFPSTSSSEQEDFNSWNYWKLPPPDLDF